MTLQLIVKCVISIALASNTMFANVQYTRALQHDQPEAEKDAEHLGQLVVNYFLSSAFCADSGSNSTISCYYTPPPVPDGYTLCSYSDSLHRELHENWLRQREVILEYANSTSDSRGPTVYVAPQEERICDSAYIFYYNADGEREYIRASLETIKELA